jgi:hypothetical protein
MINKENRMQEMTLLALTLRPLLTGKFSQGAWDVLSALRGPDESDLPSLTKEATTGIIRQVMGVERHYLGVVVTDFDTPELVEVRIELRRLFYANPYSYKKKSHFIHHAMNAFSTLGLKWEKNNGKISPLTSNSEKVQGEEG